MIIKVLGTGCASCKVLEKNAREAVKALGINATIEKVEDIMDIMKYGVMKTPALVVEDKLIVMGRIAKTEEIKEHLTQ